MGNIFAGSEIVELGIQIEKNGRDFYNTLVRRSKNPKAKEVFKYLAGEEEKHIVLFRKILNSIEKYGAPESYTGEYYAYMNALARESVFPHANKGKEIAKAIKSDKQAIDVGLEAEKDSIVFYEGMKKAVPQHDHKIISELIAQEQGHLKSLIDLKAAI